MMNYFPCTLLRLTSIEPGETITYYRGHFMDDYRRCKACKIDPVGAPEYQKLLSNIFATARAMAKQKRVKLTEKKASYLRNDGVKIKVVEYMAIGVGE